MSGGKIGLTKNPDIPQVGRGMAEPGGVEPGEAKGVRAGRRESRRGERGAAEPRQGGSKRFEPEDDHPF